jgi:CRP-like cAMP-binding protein
MLGESTIGEREALERLVRRVPFFQPLQRLDVARLVGALDRAEFPAGSLIFSEGAEADALYLLETGRVAVSVAGASNNMLTEIESPGYFGELGLLLNQRTASVQAATNVTAWKLPWPRFDGLLEERPAIAIAMARALADLLDRRSRENAGALLRVTEAPATVLQASPVMRSFGQRLAASGIVFAVPAAPSSC